MQATQVCRAMDGIVTYRKIPKIAPPCIGPSEYEPRGLVLEKCPQIQNKTKQKPYSNINFCICKELLRVCQVFIVRKCHS